MDDKDIIRKFIKYAVKFLGIQNYPKNIKIIADKNYPLENRSFGGFDPVNNQILVYTKDRHIADVIRTLGHELIHYKQKEDGKELDGETGSPIENEANAKAGILLRNFGKKYPLYEIKLSGDREPLNIFVSDYNWDKDPQLGLITLDNEPFTSYTENGKMLIVYIEKNKKTVSCIESERTREYIKILKDFDIKFEVKPNSPRIFFTLPANVEFIKFDNSYLIETQEDEFINVIKNNVENIKGIYKDVIKHHLESYDNYEAIKNTIISQIQDDFNTGEEIFGKEITDYVKNISEGNNLFTKSWWKENLLLEDHTEIIEKVVKGFELVPFPKGFSNAYKTKTGTASPLLAKQINKFIETKLKSKEVKFYYEAVYKTVNAVINKNDYE